MIVPKIYKPGERENELRALRAYDAVRWEILRWLERKSEEKAVTLCIRASMVTYGDRTPVDSYSHIYIALLEMIGWDREPDVLHVLRSANLTHQLPKPRIEEKRNDTPGTPSR